MDRAALVVLEGPEGVGKSTQVRHLGDRFERAGLRYCLVREPGGTPLGDAIRTLLLDPRWVVDARAEALLFMASRAALVRDVIRPALAAGTFVIADRFFLSTYAYQVAGRGLPETEVRNANRLATDGLVPDLTLLLDLSPEEGLRRAAGRAQHDRIERSGDAFHRLVGDAFVEFTTERWQSAHPECGPVVRIDASGTVLDVSSRIDRVIAAHFSQTLAGLAGSQW
jgi:dTMP kinase